MNGDYRNKSATPIGQDDLWSAALLLAGLLVVLSGLITPASTLERYIQTASIAAD